MSVAIDDSHRQSSLFLLMTLPGRHSTVTIPKTTDGMVKLREMLKENTA
jgi:hypothetical protein